MVSPCVYKTNRHFWKWKFWMVSNGLSVGRLNLVRGKCDPLYRNDECPQRTFPRNRLLKCLHHEKSHKIWFEGFGIFQISKFLPVLLDFWRKVKKVENKHDFWSVFVAFFPRKLSLWAPKTRNFWCLFDELFRSFQLITNHACVEPLERLHVCHRLSIFRFDMTKSSLDTKYQPNKSS